MGWFKKNKSEYHFTNEPYWYRLLVIYGGFILHLIALFMLLKWGIPALANSQDGHFIWRVISSLWKARSP